MKTGISTNGSHPPTNESLRGLIDVDGTGFFPENNRDASNFFGQPTDGRPADSAVAGRR